MTTMTNGAPGASTPGVSRLTARRAAAQRVLTTVERLVFRGDAVHVARANAWAAVLSDRERARQRAEAEAALELELEMERGGGFAARE